MLFTIDESGDIEFDSDNATFCNEIIGDAVSTNKKLIRTILTTYLLHKELLKKMLFFGERNGIEDSAIKERLDEMLDVAFSGNAGLKKYVNYIFINNGKSVDLIFYYSLYGDESEMIFNRTIEI